MGKVSMNGKMYCRYHIKTVNKKPCLKFEINLPKNESKIFSMSEKNPAKAAPMSALPGGKASCVLEP